MRQIIFALIFGFSLAVAASDCSIFEKISKAGLNENEAFWNDYAKLAQKGEPQTKDLEALMTKYQANAVTDAVGVTDTPQSISGSTGAYKSATVDLQKAAEKGYAKSPPQVQKKMDEFLSLYKQKGSADFIHDLKANRSWNYEYLKQEGRYSIRLNDGYRMTFAVDGDNLQIYDVGQHIYRH